MQRLAAVLASLAGVLVGCRSAPPIIYADTEGPRVSAQPPSLRQAHEPAERLAAVGRGQLVVRARVGVAGPVQSITIEIADSTHATVAHEMTGSVGLVTFTPMPAGSYYVSARYVGVRPQSALAVLRAGFVDTLEFQLGQGH